MSPTDLDTSKKPLLPGPATGRGRAAIRIAAATALVIGAAGGAGGMRAWDRMHPQAVTLLQPMAVSSLKDDTVVAVKGRISDRFGNSFVLQDDTGRTLVDLGRRGERADAGAADETVTVQGRFARGKLQAQVVTHADGRSDGFGPGKAPPPPPPPRGPRDAAMAPPPPPPPAGANDAAPPTSR